MRFRTRLKNQTKQLGPTFNDLVVKTFGIAHILDPLLNRFANVVDKTLSRFTHLDDVAGDTFLGITNQLDNVVDNVNHLNRIDHLVNAVFDLLDDADNNLKAIVLAGKSDHLVELLFQTVG